MKKTVSVVIATYNGEKYLKEQLDSILSQTYPVSEIIIQDDRSTDSTPAICHRYEAKFPIIHFYENENNIGFNLNFKSAAMKASCDLVALSDQDDIWFPNKIEEEVTQIGNYDLCFSDLTRGPQLESAYRVSYEEGFTNHLFYCAMGHTMLLKKDFIRHNDYWQDYLNYDWSLLIHADLEHGATKVNKPLNWHREHDCSVSRTIQLKKEKNKSYHELSKIAPYLHGFKKYREAEKTEKFQSFYQNFYNATTSKEFKLEHKISHLLLSENSMALFKLCLICMWHRKEIGPTNKSKGIMGIIRGFFFPAIYYYHNNNFK